MAEDDHKEEEDLHKEEGEIQMEGGYHGFSVLTKTLTCWSFCLLPLSFV